MSKETSNSATRQILVAKILLDVMVYRSGNTDDFMNGYLIKIWSYKTAAVKYLHQYANK